MIWLNIWMDIWAGRVNVNNEFFDDPIRYVYVLINVSFSFFRVVNREFIDLIYATRGYGNPRWKSSSIIREIFFFHCSADEIAIIVKFYDERDFYHRWLVAKNYCNFSSAAPLKHLRRWRNRKMAPEMDENFSALKVLSFGKWNYSSLETGNSLSRCWRVRPCWFGIRSGDLSLLASRYDSTDNIKTSSALVTILSNHTNIRSDTRITFSSSNFIHKKRNVLVCTTSFI